MCILIIIVLLYHTSSNCPRIITLEIMSGGAVHTKVFWSNAHDRFIIKLSLILGGKRFNDSAAYPFRFNTPCIAFHTNVMGIHI